MWCVCAMSRVVGLDRTQTVTARRRRGVDDPRLRVAVADVDVAARSRYVNLQTPRPTAVRKYNRSAGARFRAVRFSQITAF